MQTESKIIGIDLGTTNSVVAVVEGSDPVVIPNQEGANKTPSVVAFLDNNECIVGEIARRQAATNPTRTVTSIKRLIGLHHEDLAEWAAHLPYPIVNHDEQLLIDINGLGYTPQQISALIIKKLKESAEAHLGEKVSQAVITVPAHFDDNQRNATIESARMAGLEVLRLINEPTAAALAYGIGKDEDSEEIIAIYDFGGGTFDITILEISGKTFEVLCSTGDSHLGGDDLDNAIVSMIIEEFEDAHGVDLTKDPVTLRRLKEVAEKAKCDLSSSSQTVITLPFIAYRDGAPLHLERQLTRGEFEEMIDPWVNRTIKACKRAIEDAGIPKKNINKVILVGGSTRIPLVQDAVEDFFGHQPFKGINPDEVVALGAATQAGVFSGNISEVTLLDVAPHSLGIEEKGGKFSRIIEKNCTIPAKASKTFTTTEDNQPFVVIHILQGESEECAVNQSLGKFILSDIPQQPKGRARIRVTFFVNADGMMEISAEELGSGIAKSVTIQHTGLDEVERKQRKRARAKKNKPPARGGSRQAGTKHYSVEAKATLRGPADASSAEVGRSTDSSSVRRMTGGVVAPATSFEVLRDTGSRNLKSVPGASAPPQVAKVSPPQPVAPVPAAKVVPPAPVQNNPLDLPTAGAPLVYPSPQRFTRNNAFPASPEALNLPTPLPGRIQETPPLIKAARDVANEGEGQEVDDKTSEINFFDQPTALADPNSTRFVSQADITTPLSSEDWKTEIVVKDLDEAELPPAIRAALDAAKGIDITPGTEEQFREALVALSQPPYNTDMRYGILEARALLQIMSGDAEAAAFTLFKLTDLFAATQSARLATLHDRAVDKLATGVAVRRARAKFRVAAGDLEGACEDLELSTRMEPQDSDLAELERLYRLRMSKGDDPAAQFKLVKIFLKTNRVDEAIDVLQDLQHHDNYETRATKILGLCHWQKNLHFLAWQKFKQLKQNEEIRDILYRLGNDMESTGQLQNALSVYEHITSEMENYRDTQARIKKLRYRIKMQQEEADPSRLGAILTDPRFTIVEEINRGSMGIIYKAKDKTLDEIVALKLLNDYLCQDPGAVERFKREARAAKKLSHPYIVRIHDLFETGSKRFISMEYIEGQDLKRLLADRTAFIENQLVYYFLQICDALSYAHKLNIIHRDIKPANIMITKANTVKVTDFGIAKILKGEDSTKSGTAIIGTPLYMAPEQITGEGVDPRSDIYSLGIMMYELVSGHPPFYLGNIEYHHIHTMPPPLPERVSPGLRKVIMKCVEKSPSQRFQSVDEIFDALQGERRP